MMDLIFSMLLCFFISSSVSGDSNPSQEGDLGSFDWDRGRSAWNFGGFNNVKRSRPVNFPGAVIANRRQGSGKLRKGPPKKSSLLSGISQKQPTQPNKKSNQSPPKLTNRDTKLPAPSYRTQTYRLFPPAINRRAPSYMPLWNMRPQSQQKMQSRSDTISEKFSKDDLWHLDKGESYTLKSEDLERDHLLRDPFYESNELGFGPDNHDEGGHHHVKKQLEKDAEKFINQMEHDEGNAHQDAAAPQHVHHHHHYEPLKDSKKPTPPKKPDPTLLTPAILPRIHNPIPLGCLLAVPAFHPIRPRHHLKCLLSIPGTPNLNKRRRKRSTDLLQMFSNSQGMKPIVTRKHYGEQAGNNGGASSGTSRPLNIKVPATIIAPPKFENSDVLQMLMGSQGLKVKDMGTVLATNSRYVRFGRGYTGSPGSGGRQGRHLKWEGNMNSNNNVPSQQQTASASNAYPVVAKPPPAYKRPAQPTQPPTKAAPPGNAQAPPVILNVKITPVYSSAPNGPVTTQPSNQPPTVSDLPSGKWRTQENFKSADWKPISKNKSKPRTVKTPVVHNDDMDDLTSGDDLVIEESKVHFSKVKPVEGKKKGKTVKGNAATVSRNNKKAEENEAEVGLQSWIDNVYRLKKSKHDKHVKPFAFATKKNGKNGKRSSHDEEDDQDEVAVGESTTFTEMTGGSLFDELDEDDYLYSDDGEATATEGETRETIPGRYYKVKKLLLDQFPDPIIITVPKEGDDDTL